MESEAILQYPGSSCTVYSALYDLLSNPTYKRMRIAVAFASWGGAALLHEAVSDRSSPLSMNVIVGLDGGITEPEAIIQLEDWYPGCLRVFRSGEASTMFHAKTFCLDNGEGQGDLALLIGSSNLSAAGLLKNREGGFLLGLDSGESHGARDRWEAWWQQTWSAAQPVTPDLIAAYANRFQRSRRPRAPDRTHGGRRELPRVRIASANEIWIEVGAITGGSANQLEVPQDVVGFFRVDPGRHSLRREIVLTDGTNTWGHNVMAYYARNGMWRINLSTSIPEVRDRVLRHYFVDFRRTAAPDRYEFSVLDADTVRPMQAASRATGNLLTTAARVYGWL